jgi:hypothetical protein
MNFKLAILLSLVTIFLPVYANGRGPAVLPVSGISIDDYKEIPPSKAKGYRFNKGKPKSLNRKMASGFNPSNIENKTSKQVYDAKSSWPISIFLFLLLTMPFGLWFSIMKTLEKKETEIIENTIPFPSKKSKNDDDDFNYPKAS